MVLPAPLRGSVCAAMRPRLSHCSAKAALPFPPTPHTGVPKCNLQCWAAYLVRSGPCKQHNHEDRHLGEGGTQCRVGRHGQANTGLTIPPRRRDDPLPRRCTAPGNSAGRRRLPSASCGLSGAHSRITAFTSAASTPSARMWPISVRSVKSWSSNWTAASIWSSRSAMTSGQHISNCKAIASCVSGTTR
jgi:hypothetical protein